MSVMLVLSSTAREYAMKSFRFSTSCSIRLVETRDWSTRSATVFLLQHYTIMPWIIHSQGISGPPALTLTPLYQNLEPCTLNSNHVIPNATTAHPKSVSQNSPVHRRRSPAQVCSITRALAYNASAFISRFWITALPTWIIYCVGVGPVPGSGLWILSLSHSLNLTMISALRFRDFCLV